VSWFAAIPIVGIGQCPRLFIDFDRPPLGRRADPDQSSAQAGDELHLPLNGNAVTDPVQNGVAVAHRHVDNHAAKQALQCLPGPRFGSRAGLHLPPIDRETHVDGLMLVEDGAQGGERDRALHLHPRRRASHRRDRVPGEGGCQSPNTWQGTGDPISRLETFLHNHADGITSMDLAVGLAATAPGR
jgi:hypothetical protein